MSDDDPFFVGWSSDAPDVDRRFMLGAALGLTLAGIGAAHLLATRQNSPGSGQWRQSAVRDWVGLLVRDPYPMLRMHDASGGRRTAFLATTGKRGVAPPPDIGGAVTVRASAITRGRNMMLAAIDGPGWIAPAAVDVAALQDWPVQPMGNAALVGEILDAKCWFGAMKPGFGQTHKSCAAVCARGGLPLAFCTPGGALCGDSEATLLFVDEAGRPHGRALAPYVADPVSVTGRIVRIGDITQFRAARQDIRRI